MIRPAAELEKVAWYVKVHSDGTGEKAAHVTVFAPDASLYVTAATAVVVIVGASHGSVTVIQTVCALPGILYPYGVFPSMVTERVPISERAAVLYA